MGVMKELKNGSKGASKSRPNGKSDFKFTGFYPTKEQKAQIREAPPTIEQLYDVVQAFCDVGLVLSVKRDNRTDVLIATLREDKPFGEAQKAMSFWHTDVMVLFSQVVYAASEVVPGWLDADTAQNEQIEFSW